MALYDQLQVTTVQDEQYRTKHIEPWVRHTPHAMVLEEEEELTETC